MPIAARSARSKRCKQSVAQEPPLTIALLSQHAARGRHAKRAGPARSTAAVHFVLRLAKKYRIRGAHVERLRSVLSTTNYATTSVCCLACKAGWFATIALDNAAVNRCKGWLRLLPPHPTPPHQTHTCLKKQPYNEQHAKQHFRFCCTCRAQKGKRLHAVEKSATKCTPVKPQSNDMSVVITSTADAGGAVASSKLRQALSF